MSKIGIIKMNYKEAYGTEFIIDFTTCRCIIQGVLKTKIQISDGTIECAGNLIWHKTPTDIILANSWEGVVVVAEATEETMAEASKVYAEVQQEIEKSRQEAQRKAEADTKSKIFGVGPGFPRPIGRG